MRTAILFSILLSFTACDTDAGFDVGADSGVSTDSVKLAGAPLAATQATATGRLLRQAQVTGAGTTTLADGTCVVHLRGIGQGGGGGGTSSSSAGVSVGAGGSSGVLLDTWIGSTSSPIADTSVTYHGGSTGGQGGAPGAAGAAGEDSTITIAGSTYVAKGGAGGMYSASTTTTTSAFALPAEPAGGTGPAGAVSWGRGEIGSIIQGAWWSGGGGSTSLGQGGSRVYGTGSGNAGSGLGGGGAGGAAQFTTRSGGAGAPGGFAIEEYACGTLSGTTTTASSIVTVTVPVLPPSASGLLIATFDGAHPLLVQVPIRSGTHIDGFRGRVTDRGDGTQVVVQLMSTDDTTDVPVLIAGSSLSTGNGHPETVGVSGLPITALPATQYWLRVEDFFGSGTSSVSRLEIDLQP